MKTTTLGLAAAAMLGLASFATSASALPVAGAALESASTPVISVAMHHRVCHVKTVVTRGPHGRRIVRKVRTCR
jgi:hypothetical protein